MEAYARPYVSSESIRPFSSPHQQIIQDEGYQTIDGLSDRDIKPESQPRSPTVTLETACRMSSTGDETQVGLATMTKPAKRLLDAIEELRQHGIEECGISLPKICVVGDQSAGKSSLIESISDIALPKKSGTCTRCPMEIKLKDSISSELGNEWKCRVTLQKKYAYQGASARPIKITPSRPYGPWMKQEAEDYLFDEFDDKKQVSTVLRLAQLATLNPGSSPEYYKPNRVDASILEDTISNDMEVKFSPNVVQVEIWAPGLSELAFFDLPGVINASQRPDEAYLIPMVKNLTKTYINDEYCINLLAMPMTDDVAVSTSFGIIEEVKAQNRTLGVLTKPDKIGADDSYEEWASLFRGESFQLGFGFHIVKNKASSGTPCETARDDEMNFFNTTEPYMGKLASFKDRFGTRNLLKTLSDDLTEHIKNSLEGITEKINDKLFAVDQELKTLPEPPKGDLPIVIERGIAQLSQHLEQHIEGGWPDRPFQKEWYDLALEFRQQLLDSKPTLHLPVPRLSQKTAPQADQEDVFMENGTAVPLVTIEDDGYETCRANNRGARLGVNRKRHLDNPAPGTPPSRRRKMTNIPRFNERVLGKRFSLQEIREMIRNGRIGLPGQIDNRVSERMSRIGMQHWDQLSTAFLEKTGEMCLKLVSTHSEEAFLSWKQTPLYKHVQGICESFVSQMIEHQRSAVKRCLDMELHRAMTFDEDGMKQSQDKALIILKTGRLTQRAKIRLIEEENKVGKQTTLQVIEEKAAKMNEAQLGPDPFEQEINVMAVSKDLSSENAVVLIAKQTVKAYYERAFSRFVDSIALGIHFELFEECRSRLPTVLRHDLGIERPNGKYEEEISRYNH
ncbi:hypothetical protein MMC17_003383 [Xylographa soralifera]|nr:hypothetical protein [Xylographa soralifera]